MKKVRILSSVLMLVFFIFNSWAEDKNLAKTIRWLKDDSIMILIPAGEFWMGLDDKDQPKEKITRGEKPRHKVYLANYYIDKFEVTNQQYFKFCLETGHRLPLHLKEGKIPSGKENHPVNHINFEDAQAYCQWAGKRLPTEAEWEKACRGNDYRFYPWGNFWQMNLSNNRTSSYEDTVAVGSFPKGASPYGVMDMAGNVWEWTLDWYQSYAGSDTVFDETGKSRVTRGGAYFYSIFLQMCPARNPLPPNDISEFNGFRCLVEMEKVKFSGK